MIKRLIIIFLLFAPTLVFAQDFSNLSALVTLNKDTSAEVEFNLTLQSSSHVIEIFIGDLAVDSVLVSSNSYTLSRRECSIGRYIVCQRKDGVASTDWKVKFSVSKFISFFSKQDEFFWIITDGSQKYSIDELLVTLALPAGSDVTKYKTTIYAIKGVGSYSSRVVAPTQIEFRGLDIIPGSNFTVVLDVPKGIFSAQVSQRIFNVIAQSVIFLLAIIAPLFSIIFLLFIIARNRKTKFLLKQETEALNYPPSDLQPAVAGTLADQIIDAFEMTATIIDLAFRGYLVILYDQGKIFFGKRKPFDDLSTYEKLLAEKLFFERGIKSSKEEMEKEVANEFSDERVGDIYTNLYKTVTEQGFFEKNPGLRRSMYRAIGATIFFFGFLFMIISAFFVGNQLFTIAFVGVLICGLEIVNISKFLRFYSSKGISETKAWAGFVNYLSLQKSASHQDFVNDIFFKYLPYAIVFNVIDQWAARFSDFPFRRPDWYVSYDTVTLDQILSKLLPAIYQTAKSLDSVKHPSFE